jgi:lipopolysaccharide/colanic/teichoic acid biosynthesis glycosyltransferase
MIRCLDIFLATLALVALAPVLIPVAFVLRFTGEGEIFFLQDRVGKDEKKFKLLKFATMLKNSPDIGTGTLTLRNDPRVLPVGRLLRKTKINELPQLLNILFGDMSVIGPRPLTDNHFKLMPVASREKVSSVKPGLSGVGSIIFRDEERLMSGKEDPRDYYDREIAPYKAVLEAWFVDNQGIIMYLKCIILTVWVVLFPSPKIATLVFRECPLPMGQLKTDLEMSS